MYQNVSDEAISASESASFIIAQMTAFGIEAENAEHIIDAVNETANSFAVSSGQLANSLGIVSSTASAMGNSMEETIGMMTAITEQTRNSSKAARGLNTIFNNLAQVLDDSSSNGKKIAAIYEELGVSMYGLDGQLLSSYELLTNLNQKWDTLDTNTKNYIASTIAGTNQLNNFLALMNNFDHAVEATETALNSAGSATRENERYMESLNAKTNQLKATFQDLANNVIENELVSSLLTLANDALSAVNNEVGQTVIQFTLLTGALTGFLSISATLLKHLSIMASAIKGATAVAGAGGLAGALGAVASAALPIAAIIAAIVVAGYGLYKLSNYLHPSLEEIEEDLQNDKTLLEENKKRLEELNSVTYVARTPEIEEEIRALEKENAELEKNIELNEERANRKRLTQIQTEGSFLTEQKGIDLGLQNEQGDLTYSFTSPNLSGLINQLVMAGKLGEEWIEISDKLIDGTVSYDEALGDLKEELGDQIAFLEEWSSGTNTLEASLQDLLRQYDSYNQKLANGETLTIAEQQAFLKLRDNISEAYDALKDIDPETEGYTQTITDFLEKAEDIIPTFEDMTLKVYGFTDANQEAEVALGRAANGIAILTEDANKLKQVYPELNEYLVEQNGLWTINTDLIFDSAAAGEEWAQRMADSFIKASEEALEYNKVIGRVLLAIARETRQKYGAGSPEDVAAWNEYKAVLEEIYSLSESIRLRKAQQLAFPEIEDVETSLDNTSTAAKTLIDLLKEELEILDHQAFLLEKNGQDQLKLVTIYEQAQQKIHALADQYRKKGYLETSAEIRELQQLWWDYANEIDSVYKSIEDVAKEAAEEAKESWMEAQESLIEDLNDKKSAYETAFSYMANQIQEEISLLEQQREEEEKYWDSKINALEEQNDAIQRQIELEELQDQLARSRQTEVFVYKDGKFQYINDIDEVSEAQANLESWEREEALRQEVENLEKLKDQALQNIDDQIEGWEKYKEEWSSVVSDYQEEQDKLIAEQILGIELEGNNWKTRLDNLQSYIAEYKSLLAELSQAQLDLEEGQNVSVSTSTGSGGGSVSTSGLPSAPSRGEVGTAWIPGTGVVKVDISGGKTQTSGLPVGTIVSTAGGDYQITGGTGGNYTSVKVGKNASGTLSSSGGISLVGENGPELRVLGQGDGVIPADVTKNLWAWGVTTPASMLSALTGLGSIGNNMTVNIENLNLPGIHDGEGFVDYMRTNFWRKTLQFQTT